TWAHDKHENISIINDLLHSFMQDAKAKLPAPLVESHKDIIASIFSEPDTHALLNQFLNLKTKDEWLLKAQSNIKHGSPLHALIIHRQLKESVGRNLLEAFQSEARLSTNIVRFSEFAEGIRALLIDKDRQPKWCFASHDEIPDDFVDRFFVEPWP